MHTVHHTALIPPRDAVMAAMAVGEGKGVREIRFHAFGSGDWRRSVFTPNAAQPADLLGLAGQLAIGRPIQRVSVHLGPLAPIWSDITPDSIGEWIDFVRQLRFGKVDQPQDIYVSVVGPAQWRWMDRTAWASLDDNELPELGVVDSPENIDQTELSVWAKRTARCLQAVAAEGGTSGCGGRTAAIRVRSEQPE